MPTCRLASAGTRSGVTCTPNLITKRVNYSLPIIILLIIKTASLTDQLKVLTFSYTEALTNATPYSMLGTDSNTLKPNIDIQTGSSSTTGELAPVDKSGQTQQQPKPLELLLRASQAKPDNEVNAGVYSQTSQNNLETSSRATKVDVASLYTATPATPPSPVTAPNATASIRHMVSGAESTQSPPQTRSLKFTLIAGRAWKFTIKGNSLSSLKGSELRLHKNISNNNYIIDDEGWFQYNPQLQQLFAWPSLATKSGTYYFVLLPSGIDIEADSENIVNLEVAASIVVELIKPVYQGVRTSDFDQFIDHEFSLDYLHRHTAYPLLLNQIFSIFEILVKPNSANLQTATNSPSLLTTIGPSQQVAIRSSYKLGEYLLVNSSYSSDGELFSVTWSTHPALLNNTLTPINECRLNTITDTISKLSGLSSGYQSDVEKFTILYVLEIPQNSSQAIVPTEHSNVLKLTLNRPCQRTKIIEELGIQQQTSKVAGVVPSADVNENNIIADKPATSTTALITTNPSTTISPLSHGFESSVSSAANQITQSDISSPNYSHQSVITNTTTTVPQVVINANQPRSISHQNSASDIVSDVPIVSSSSPSIETEPPVIKSSNTPLLQPKLQPQAKSFEDFLEMSDVQPNSTLASGSSEFASSQQTNISIVNSVETSTINGDLSVSSTKTVAPVSSESTFSEDFMGILDEVMNYLVSVAIPASIIVGTILLLSIIIALCHLYRKRKKSKEFQVRNRFDFRYSSERKGFLKNSTRPVILEADQKSLSMGGTPQHKATTKNKQKMTDEDRKHYLPMSTMYYEASGSAGVDGSREASMQEKND